MEEEYRDYIDALKKYHEYEKQTIKNRIANAVRSIYDDVKESIQSNEEMDLMLGEIYRDKIKEIVWALRNEGIQL